MLKSDQDAWGPRRARSRRVRLRITQRYVVINTSCSIRNHTVSLSYHPHPVWLRSPVKAPEDDTVNENRKRTGGFTGCRLRGHDRLDEWEHNALHHKQSLFAMDPVQAASRRQTKRRTRDFRPRIAPRRRGTMRARRAARPWRSPPALRSPRLRWRCRAYARLPQCRPEKSLRQRKYEHQDCAGTVVSAAKIATNQTQSALTGARMSRDMRMAALITVMVMSWPCA